MESSWVLPETGRQLCSPLYLWVSVTCSNSSETDSQPPPTGAEAETGISLSKPNGMYQRQSHRKVQVSHLKGHTQQVPSQVLLLSELFLFTES